MKTSHTFIEHGPYKDILAVGSGTPADDALNHASALLSSAVATLIAGANAEDHNLIWSAIYNLQVADGLLQSVILDVEATMPRAYRPGAQWIDAALVRAFADDASNQTSDAIFKALADIGHPITQDAHLSMLSDDSGDLVILDRTHDPILHIGADGRVTKEGCKQ